MPSISTPFCVNGHKHFFALIRPLRLLFLSALIQRVQYLVCRPIRGRRHRMHFIGPAPLPGTGTRIEPQNLRHLLVRLTTRRSGYSEEASRTHVLFRREFASAADHCQGQGWLDVLRDLDFRTPDRAQSVRLCGIDVPTWDRIPHRAKARPIAALRLATSDRPW
jgi:hypothetical protein